MTGVCEEEWLGRSKGNEALTLRDVKGVGCHGYMKPLRVGNLSVASPTTKGHKGENFFLFFSF